jgi:uncharacterized protein YqeY
LRALWGEVSGRPTDFAEEETAARREVLEHSFTAQLDAAALESVIKGISSELGSTQIGPVMTELRKRHAGQFDGKLASEIIKKLAG